VIPEFIVSQERFVGPTTSCEALINR
jgi:hypothetical protein